MKHKADTRIGEDIDGRVSGVSGGERRRVSVGIGLVTDPRVIFLDEPTTGLDSDSALTLVKVLKRLAQRGRTVSCHPLFPEPFHVRVLLNSVLLRVGSHVGTIKTAEGAYSALSALIVMRWVIYGLCRFTKRGFDFH